jgi:predicted ATPase
MSNSENSTPLANLLKTVAAEKVPGFVVDAANRDILNQMYYYLAQSPRFEFTEAEQTTRTGNYLGRGNMFAGNPGCGKTDLMRIMQTCLYRMKDTRVFATMSMIDFSRNYGHKDDRGNVIDMLTKYEGRHLFVDEFGMIDEHTGLRKYEVITNFGTKLDLGEMLILQRYNEFKRGYITHLTTNIRPDELQKQYDSRTVSRIYEMCNVFPVIGPDRRRTAQPRTNLAPPPPTTRETFLDLLPIIKEATPEAYDGIVKELDKMKARMILQSEAEYNASQRPKLTQESALNEFKELLPQLSMPALQDALKQAELKQNRELTQIIENELATRNKAA